MSRIKDVRARQISDSRGNPTVEAHVYLESGKWGWAAVPSGSSRGEREALELRDTDSLAYRGMGVGQAVANINTTINLALRRHDIKDSDDQRKIDGLMLELDGTKFKTRLGANAILAVSLAVADAASKEICGDHRLFEYIAQLHGRTPGYRGCTLPVPLINVINGGVHADNRLRPQEFMIIPVGAHSVWDAIKKGRQVFRAIETLVELIPDNPAVGVGDEGGYAPVLCPDQGQEARVREALNLIMRAIEMAGLQPGHDVVLAMDPAASEFYSAERQEYEFYDGKDPVKTSFSSEQMIDFYEGLVNEYPIRSIEDGLAEKDEAGWISLTRRLGKRLQLVGDDLFVTNPDIFRAGIEKGMANSILIKVNQIGTLSETLDTMSLAEDQGYACIVSHRSGETLDTKIADIAVGCNAGQIKTGSICRGDRIAKYNRLKDIEAALGEGSRFPGSEVFSKFLTSAS